MDESVVLALEVLAVQAERLAAARDLADMGINASPADTEAWVAADSRTKKRLGLAWAAMQGIGGSAAGRAVNDGIRDGAEEEVR